MRRSTFSQLHLGQQGFSFPKTRHSKFWLQASQWYSYMGISKFSYYQFIVPAPAAPPPDLRQQSGGFEFLRCNGSNRVPDLPRFEMPSARPRPGLVLNIARRGGAGKFPLMGKSPHFFHKRGPLFPDFPPCLHIAAPGPTRRRHHLDSA